MLRYADISVCIQLVGGRSGRIFTCGQVYCQSVYRFSLRFVVVQYRTRQLPALIICSHRQCVYTEGRQDLPCAFMASAPIAIPSLLEITTSMSLPEVIGQPAFAQIFLIWLRPATPGVQLQLFGFDAVGVQFFNHIFGTRFGIRVAWLAFQQNEINRRCLCSSPISMSYFANQRCLTSPDS